MENDFPLDTSASGLLEGNQVDTTSSTFSAPTTQPDFNSQGEGDVLKVLTAGAGAIGSLATAAATLGAIPGQIKVQRAVADQGNALALQSIATQGAIAKIQGQTQIAQAQAAFKKAAGIVDGNTWTLVLTAAGVGLAAVALFMHKG